MGYFSDSQQLQDVWVGFFQELTRDATIAPKLKDSKLIMKFIYTDPDLSITVDCSQDPIVVQANDATKAPDVEMKMKADTAHRFWFGKVNLIMALARREISAKGPIPKILKLLPVIKPAYRLYPQYLKDKGFTELANTAS